MFLGGKKSIWRSEKAFYLERRGNIFDSRVASFEWESAQRAMNWMACHFRQRQEHTACSRVFLISRETRSRMFLRDRGVLDTQSAQRAMRSESGYFSAERRAFGHLSVSLIERGAVQHFAVSSLILSRASDEGIHFVSVLSSRECVRAA